MVVVFVLLCLRCAMLKQRFKKGMRGSCSGGTTHVIGMRFLLCQTTIEDFHSFPYLFYKITTLIKAIIYQCYQASNIYVSILIKINSCPDQSIAYISVHVALKMRMYYTHVTYVRQVKTVSNN